MSLIAKAREAIGSRDGSSADHAGTFANDLDIQHRYQSGTLGKNAVPAPQAVEELQQLAWDIASDA